MPKHRPASEPHTLTEILGGQAAGLRPILNRARWLAQLERQLPTLLPQPLASHCRAALDPDGALVLFADSPAWTTALRLQLPALKRALPATAALSLRIRTLPVNPASPPPPSRPAQMSPAAAEALTELAQHTEDEKLRAALQRLARNAKSQGKVTTGKSRA